jgi:hypothetical protein
MAGLGQLWVQPAGRSRATRALPPHAVHLYQLPETQAGTLDGSSYNVFYKVMTLYRV